MAHPTVPLHGTRCLRALCFSQSVRPQQCLFMPRRHKRSERPDTRNFSLSAKAAAKRKEQSPFQKQKMGQSMNVTQAEAKKKMELPDDMGLLPGTFVTPISSHRPKPWKNVQGWGRWEWARFKARARDIASMAVFKYWFCRTVSAQELRAMPWSRWFKTKFFTHPKLQVRQISALAKTEYERMYTNLACKTIAAPERLYCSSILLELQGRIASLKRHPDVLHVWKVHKWLESPRLVSYRITLMSTDEQPHKRSSIAQAVVRMHSMQSLKKYKITSHRDGKASRTLMEGSMTGPNDSGVEKVEYLVMQQMRKKGELEPWKVWGTTEETTLKTVDEGRRGVAVESAPR